MSVQWPCSTTTTKTLAARRCQAHRLNTVTKSENTSRSFGTGIAEAAEQAWLQTTCCNRLSSRSMRKERHQAALRQARPLALLRRARADGAAGEIGEGIAGSRSMNCGVGPNMQSPGRMCMNYGMGHCMGHILEGLTMVFGRQRVIFLFICRRYSTHVYTKYLHLLRRIVSDWQKDRNFGIKQSYHVLRLCLFTPCSTSSTRKESKKSG